MSSRSTRKAGPTSGRDATPDSARSGPLVFKGVKFKPYHAPRVPSPRRFAESSAGDLTFGERTYDLYDRFRLLSKTYNPRNIDLHFDNPPRTDAALFEGLLAIGCETWLVASHCLNIYRCLPKGSVDYFMGSSGISVGG